jgi:hypothetical protein
LRLIFTFCGLIVTFGFSFCQTDSMIFIPASIRLAYNSSLIYPGAASSLDFPVRNIELIKLKNDTFKSISKSRFISFNLGYYHHYGFHDNLYIMPEWIMRRANPGPFFTEFSAGLGYSRTFLGGTTYRVDESGNISIVPWAGYSYAIAAIGLGFGYDYTSAKKISLSFYSRLKMLVLFPYNSTFYPRPTLELGIIYKPEKFLSRKVHVVHKMKPSNT